MWPGGCWPGCYLWVMGAAAALGAGCWVGGCWLGATGAQSRNHGAPVCALDALPRIARSLFAHLLSPAMDATLDRAIHPLNIHP